MVVPAPVFLESFDVVSPWWLWVAALGPLVAGLSFAHSAGALAKVIAGVVATSVIGIGTVVGAFIAAVGGVGDDGRTCRDFGGYRTAEDPAGWYCDWGFGVAGIGVLVVGLFVIVWLNRRIWRQPTDDSSGSA